MRLLLLHLSDLHFCEPAHENASLSRIQQLASAVGSLPSTPDIACVVVSGDIAFSGRPPEYEIAARFFAELRGELTGRLGGTSAATIFVPGNHDCDFALETSLREMILADSTGRAFDPDMVETCLEVQQAFWHFTSSCPSSPATEARGNSACRVHTLTIGGARVSFRLLNTALLSRHPEVQGSLVFPVELWHEERSSADEESPAITVTVLHHPYNWLESSNARAIRTLVEAASDIVLTGHEHEDNDFHVSGLHGQEVEYVEGAVLQDPSDSDASGFNIVAVDTEAGTQRVHRFRWHKKEQIYAELDPATELPFVRNAHRLRNEFRLRADFEQQLVDPGAPLTHPRKERITLDDIFVYPDLRIMSSPMQEQGGGALVRDGVADFLANERRVMILGPDKSGKTTLSKVVFSDLRRRGIVPVLIAGGDLKKPDENATRALISDAYGRQYVSPEAQQYWQLAASKRAIIVDDSHLIRSNARGRDRMIRELERIADIVILVGEDASRFEDLLRPESADLRIWSYVACQILPLGNLKRSDLIAKWVFLGLGLTDDERDLLWRSKEKERLINDLVGRSVCPSYPLFVLVLLQQLETNTRHNLSPQSGSYGFLYETLLTSALTATSQLRVDLDTQYSYLSELAYSLFERRERAVPRAQLYEWHGDFCSAFGLRLDLDSLVGGFVAAGVLHEKHGHVGFRYPYLNYYFVSRYFHEHLEEKAIREHVSRMASRLHHEESANILLFLTYLSKDPFILDSIVDAAEGLFSGYSDFDLDKGAAFLGPLLEDIPNLVLEAGDPEARRRRLLAQQDELEAETSGADHDQLLSYEEIDTDDVLDDLLKVNVAFKTVQILGQVLRNYPGSLKAPEKQRIAEEAFSLGLRVLTFMMASLEQNKEAIIEALLDLVQEKHPHWDQERVKTKLGEAVVNLAEGVAFVITKQVADSTGDEKLAFTFDKMLEASPTASYSLIDLCIRLFYFEQFPELHVTRLQRDVGEKAFPARMLRHMVWYRFYLYPSRYDLMQSVCERLGIEMGPEFIADQRPKLLPSP